jgi:hypothetical protein
MGLVTTGFQFRIVIPTIGFGYGNSPGLGKAESKFGSMVGSYVSIEYQSGLINVKRGRQAIL